MSNHYRLLVETRQGNLSRGMCQLNGVNTPAFNRRRGRCRVSEFRFRPAVVKWTQFFCLRAANLIRLAAVYKSNFGE
jgi:hypothetical protein